MKRFWVSISAILAVTALGCGPKFRDTLPVATSDKNSQAVHRNANQSDEDSEKFQEPSGAELTLFAQDLAQLQNELVVLSKTVSQENAEYKTNCKLIHQFESDAQNQTQKIHKGFSKGIYGLGRAFSSESQALLGYCGEAKSSVVGVGNMSEFCDQIKKAYDVLDKLLKQPEFVTDRVNSLEALSCRSESSSETKDSI